MNSLINNGQKENWFLGKFFFLVCLFLAVNCNGFQLFCFKIFWVLWIALKVSLGFTVVLIPQARCTKVNRKNILLPRGFSAHKVRTCHLSSRGLVCKVLVRQGVHASTWCWAQTVVPLTLMGLYMCLKLCLCLSALLHGGIKCYFR